VADKYAIVLMTEVDRRDHYDGFAGPVHTKGSRRRCLGVAICGTLPPVGGKHTSASPATARACSLHLSSFLLLVSQAHITGMSFDRKTEGFAGPAEVIP
jgi:hypothetical protein